MAKRPGSSRQTRDIDRAIGNQLRGLRIARGLSLEQVAKVLGVSYQQVQKYEAGTSSLTAPRLYAVRKALSIKLDDLFPPNGKMAELPLSVPGIELGKYFDRIEDAAYREALLVLARTAATRIREGS